MTTHRKTAGGDNLVVGRVVFGSSPPSLGDRRDQVESTFQPRKLEEAIKLNGTPGVNITLVDDPELPDPPETDTHQEHMNAIVVSPASLKAAKEDLMLLAIDLTDKYNRKQCKLLFKYVEGILNAHDACNLEDE